MLIYLHTQLFILQFTEYCLGEYLGLKILIAEDEEDIARIFSDQLGERGHEVVITHNGVECLNEFRHALRESSEGKTLPFDLILVDYVMPQKDGIALVKDILKERPDQRVIFVTGHAAMMLKHIEEIEGTVDVLNKPVPIRALIAKVEGESKLMKKLRYSRKEWDGHTGFSEPHSTQRAY